MKFCHFVAADEGKTRDKGARINGQISSHDKINYYLQLTMWNNFIASLDRFYAINAGHVLFFVAHEESLLSIRTLTVHCIWHKWSLYYFGMGTYYYYFKCHASATRLHNDAGTFHDKKNRY